MFINHRGVQDLFLLVITFAPLSLGDEFFASFARIPAPGSFATQTISCHVPLVRGRFTWYMLRTSRFLRILHWGPTNHSIKKLLVGVLQKAVSGGEGCRVVDDGLVARRHHYVK